ncbi:MAG TPA: hypothetical protein VM869_09625 [Enhygromyxa sp.]|nr:hypothetical protein [Enhygromyxa sp.]
MDKLEQLASAHESFSDLLHAIDPLVLIGLVCAAAGIPMPDVVDVRYRNSRIEIPGLSKPARKKIVDLVYTTLSADGQLEVWILEIELSYDWLKVIRWALYELAFQSEHNAHSARVAVLTPEPELRERIRTKILPRMKTSPVLLEPDQIERITDYQEARRRPELAILGCLFHAQPPAPFEAQVEVFRAAWMAIQSLAETEARRYSVLVMSLVPEAVQNQGIAELRETGELDEYGYELFTESERKGGSFARGHREGVETGRIQTLRRAVLDVLELRGFEVSEAVRERVESCESIEQLERWYAAAKSGPVQSPDQLLDG